MVNIKTTRHQAEAGWFNESHWPIGYAVNSPWMTDHGIPMYSARESRYLFQRMVKKANLHHQFTQEGVCYIDQNWKIRSVNPEGERLIGMNQASVQNKPLYDCLSLLSAQTRAPIFDYSSLAEIFQDHEVLRNEDTILKRKDGTEVEVESVFCPLMHDQQFIGAVIMIRDITALKRLEASLLTHTAEIIEGQSNPLANFDKASKDQLEIIYAKEHDLLTGLLNRTQFEIKLQEVIESARNLDVQHAILSLDLDQFKVLNDACGHLAGDECLRQIAKLIEGKVRKWDIVARLGGDEFGLILLYCSQSQALRIAEDISTAIHNHRFIWQGMSFSFGASIGIVIVDIKETDTNSVMRKADLACNTAKEQGRNRTYIFRDDDAHITARNGEVSCIGQITNALQEDRFELFYQKIIPIQNQENEGEHYEILVRMFDENGDYLSPQLFLPAAERYNMISRIDGWIVRKTCELLSTHPAVINELHLCAINLSGQSLNDPRFYDYVLEVINDYQVPLNKLCFEVTETGTIANINNAVKFITRLRSLGVHFALDDFGSGLSSFAYLRSMPVDYVKIDGMFVKAMDTNEIDYAMVKSINEMAHNMGKKTVAEFVENAKILEMLKEVGVDYAQGYGIAKPRRFIDYLESKS